MSTNDNVNVLVGKTLTKITGGDSDIITFFVDDGSVYKMYHQQDCCESVYIESIEGDLQNLVGTPILVAEECTNVDEPPTSDDSAESVTWTFYSSLQ